MTIRPDHISHEIPVSEWTEEEGFEHLRKTFDIECRNWPDVMEPYAIRLADCDDRTEATQIMRSGLRETIMVRR